MEATQKEEEYNLTQLDKDITEVQKITTRVEGRITRLVRWSGELKKEGNDRRCGDMIDTIPIRIRECVQMIELYRPWIREGYNPKLQVEFFEKEAVEVLKLALERLEKFRHGQQEHELSQETVDRLIFEAEQAIKIYAALLSEAEEKQISLKSKANELQATLEPQEPQKTLGPQEPQENFLSFDEQQTLSKKSPTIGGTQFTLETPSKQKDGSMSQNNMPSKKIMFIQPHELETQKIKTLKKDPYWAFYAELDRLVCFLSRKLLSPPASNNPVFSPLQQAQLLLYTLKKYFGISKIKVEEHSQDTERNDPIEVKLDRAKYCSSIADYVYEFLTSTFCIDAIKDQTDKHKFIDSVDLFINNLLADRHEPVDADVKEFERNQLMHVFRLSTELDESQKHWRVLIFALVALKHSSESLAENEQLSLSDYELEKIDELEDLKTLLEEDLSQATKAELNKQT